MKNIIIILLIIALILIINIIIKNKNKKNNNKYIKKQLMTNNEKYFYNILKELENELNIKIQPQINLATIVKKVNNNKYINELFRNIDFGIFNKDYENLLLLIEIDDISHKNKNRIIRDKKVNKILKEAQIKLIRFYTKYPNKPEYVKNRIIEELKKTE